MRLHIFSVQSRDFGQIKITFRLKQRKYEISSDTTPHIYRNKHKDIVVESLIFTILTQTNMRTIGEANYQWAL
jgi:hypothetical protein